jgi:hypothetical protein
MTSLMVLSAARVVASADSVRTTTFDFAKTLQGVEFTVLAIAGTISLLMVLLTLFLRSLLQSNKKERNLYSKLAKILFASIIIPVIVATIFIVGSTIYINTLSLTKGPVHWHADFEVWRCGEKIDFVDPKGLSNRIGSPLFHEHGDNRIHVEGKVLEYKDVSLQSFFEVVGGKLTSTELVMPTNRGLLSINSGDMCGSEQGEIQIFAYSVTQMDEQSDVWEVVQRKVDPHYVLAEHSYVPPGDCIIIEYDVEKEFTEKICTPYQIALDKGDIKMMEIVHGS